MITEHIKVKILPDKFKAIPEYDYNMMEVLDSTIPQDRKIVDSITIEIPPEVKYIQIEAYNENTFSVFYRR